MHALAWPRARAVRFALVLFLVTAFSVLAVRVRADHADARLAAIRTALSSFSGTVATFDTLVGLADDLPLTEASAAEKLKLGATLAAVQAKLDAASNANLHDASSFASFLANTVSGTYGGVAVDISGPAAGDADDPIVNIRPETEHLVDLVIEIAITADDVELPIAYDDGIVALDGSQASGSAGRFEVDFSLRTNPLHFQLDTAALASPDAGVRASAFWLRTVPEAAFVPGTPPPAMTVRAAAAAASLGSFDTVLGFADISVSGVVTANLGATLTLNDPAAVDGDSDDRISATEWGSSDLATLVTPAWLDAPGDDFTAEIRLSSSMIDTSLDPHDASLAFALPAAGGGLPAPVLSPDASLGALVDFRNFTAPDALSALNRLAGLLQGMQDTGKLDLQLPFVEGTFSDAVRLSELVLDATADLTTTDVSGTPEDESGRPTFATFLDLLAKLGVALPSGSTATGGSYDPATKRLTFDLALSDSATRSLPIDFGTIDVLSGIGFTTGGTALLHAAYDVNATVGFDLSPEPTEGAGAPVGSCQDGIDNNPSESTAVDAADPACAGSRTLEQRVFVDVGASGTPEVKAGLSFRAVDFDAKARIGMLEAGIDNGSLIVGATATEDGGPAGSCRDGVDNGGSDGADADDPECTFIAFDVFRSGSDTVLTLEEMFNTIGGSGPSGAALGTSVGAALAATLPVSASLTSGGPAIASADVTISASHTGPFDPLALADSVNVDASALHLSELFSFSPCGNGVDDDGDGTAEDGCPGSGVDAVDDPELLSTALFDQLVQLVRLVAGRVEALQAHVGPTGDSLDEPLPLVGRSLNDLLSFAQTLEEVASDLETVSEAQSDRPGACTNSVDDDGDGITNDGCPTVGDSPEAGAECVNDVDSPAANDPDLVVNDGCPPARPTLQTIADQLEKLVNGAIADLAEGGATGVTPTSTFTLAYDDATNEIQFTADVGAVLARSVPLDVDLSDIAGFAGKHLAFGSTGALGVSVDAGLDAVLGVDLDDLRPFILGNPKLEVGAAAGVPNLVADATLGPVQLSIGTHTAAPETACDDDVDNDGDGVVDDGSDAACDAPAAADKGRLFLGADFTLEGNGAADARHYLDTGGLPPLTATFDGDPPSQCGTDDACAVLPLYLNGAALGSEASGGHHVELTMADITDPSSLTVAYTGDPATLAASFAQQLLDLALVGTGLGELLARLEALLAGELLSIELPLVGDQLAEIAGFIRKLRTDPDSLLAILNGTTDPMDALMDAAEIKAAIQTTFADAVGTALLPILQDTDGNGTVTAADFVATVRCGTNGDAPCDTGGEDDPANEAADTPGDNCATGNNASDDGTDDNRVNDGCPSRPNPETDCSVDGDGHPVDEDGDGTANDGCPGTGIAATETSEGADAESGSACENSIDDDGDDYVNDGCDVAIAPGSAVSEIRFKAKLGQTATAISPDFDLATGMPGLGLDVDAKIAGTADWTAWLNFGVNRDGFFLVTNPTDHTGTPVPELSFGADVTIPGTTLDGTLGFLRVQVQDGEPAAACNGGDALCNPDGDDHVLEPTSINPRFVVDIDDPGTDDRFTMNELVSGFDFGDVATFTFSAEANLGLHTETSFVGAGATLPRLFADIDLDWNFALTTASSDPGALVNNGFGTPCGSTPASEPANCFSLVLNDVAIDAGTFLTSFLGPMLRNVQEYTKVLDPAIKVANEPIPGLSDLAGEPVTLLKLADLFGGSGSEKELLVALVKLASFVNGLQPPAPGANLTIPIGDQFALDGARLQQGTLSSAQAREAFANASDLNLDSLLDDIDGKYAGGVSPGAQVTTVQGLESSIGLTFPFLQQPGKLMGLMFGQDVDLAVWHSPRLNVGFTYAQKFGPIWATPPVFVELGGSLSLLGEIALGYDTQGLREMAFEGASADALLRGLFVLDKYNGQDPNILTLRGELFANAQVSVAIFSAGAGGKFYTTIGIDVRDPNADGKTKFQEVAELLRATGSPLCLFDLNGGVGINVYAFAEVDLLFWSQRWEKTIADALLFEFKVVCDPAAFTPPVLASKDASNVVTLHLGAHRAARGGNSVAKDEKVEKFKVKKLSNAPDSGVEVSAFGFTTVIDGPVSKIVADGGTDGANGADVITLADNLVDDVPVPFDVPSDVTLSDGADVFVGGLARDVVRGKNGADVITLLDGTNEAHGGPGNDRIQGGTGTDTLHGDGENDVINGELGGDFLYGGPGDDQLVGGLSTVNTVVQPGSKIGQSVAGATDGDDTVEGGSGRDTIDGGDGIDTLRGGPDGDNINGGPGNDIIEGGGGGDETVCAASNPKGDVIAGGPGGDTISGNGGDDIIIGGNATPGGADEGDPQLNGDAGCDRIFGDNATLAGGAPAPADPGIGGGDTMDGGPDADRLYGQTGADTMAGAGGADRLWGADGNDVVDAGDGDDFLYGEAGDDDLVGGDGKDVAHGGDGLDVLLGDRGSVTRNATSQRDDDPITLSGGTGDDDLYGGTGADVAYGQASADELFGQSGDDDLYGGSDDDVVSGGTGVDHIEGNDGGDDLSGDSGGDRILGGSSDSTTADTGRDEIHGREGHDVIAGDNATGSGTAVVLESESSIGDGDLVHGDAGEDRIFAGRGVDEVYGGYDDDYIEGNDGGDRLFGEHGDDDMIGGTSQAASGDPDGQGGQPDDGDVMEGGSGADVLVGDNGRITRTGGVSPFLIGAEERDVEVFDLDETDLSLSGIDTMRGGLSNDQLFGGGDDDVMYGDVGDDYVEGNAGSDDIWGGEGQDDLVGGTSAEAGDDAGGAHPDGADDIVGGDGDGDRDAPLDDADVIAGDNASIRRFTTGDPAVVVTDDLDPTRAGFAGVVRRQVVLYDVASTTFPNPVAPGGQAVSGGETIHGEAGPDVVYGQGGNDAIHGEGSDDYLEGNAGDDTLYGEAGQDDLVGGTGRSISDDPTSAEDGRLDGVDRLHGGDGTIDGGDDATGVDDFDVLVGDNATVLRDVVGDDHEWEVNSYNDSVRRRVWLYDVSEVGAPAAAGTSAGDFLYGEADPDLGYGQGGNDHVEGAGGDDYLEGNDGNDTILGQVGNDDLIGGTGRINADGAEGTDGRLDAGETLIQGGPGFDTITGDNAVVARVLAGTPAQWVANTFNAGIAHEPVRLLDVAALGSPAGGGTSGGDTIEGNADDDVIYGQGGADVIAGDDPAPGPGAGEGDDYVEGNEGDDVVRGGPGEDDLVGGTGLLAGDPTGGVHGRLDGADQIRGEYAEEEGAQEGDGGDWIFGDNAVVSRPLTPLPAGDWIVNEPNGVTVRTFVLLDLEPVASPADDAVHGGDVVYGNDNDDTVYGQGGDDELHGGAGDDDIDGNSGADRLFGDGHQDDLIGGNHLAGHLDGDDQLSGGPGADFQLGDNGTLVRPVVDDEWTTFADYNPTTIVRLATRFDVDGPAGTFGADLIHGDGGDDYQWGQDGNDELHGDDDNDDMYGELGDDQMFGGRGEDAMVGDRGNIVDTKLADDSRKVSVNTKGPAFFVYTGLVAGQLDRRVSLTDDGDGAPYPAMGVDTGGKDRMRGGPGHDSMHGAFGDDLMNGDSGGDWLFGADGADVMWGGKGADPLHVPEDAGLHANARDRDRVGYTDPFQDRYVDLLFGGHGGLHADEVLAADILDYLPRMDPNGFPIDPVSWFEMTDLDDVDHTNDQHHQGIDWIYGGFDRDVLEGDVGKNGPDFGDRLIDWTGAFNLFTRCNASYGDDGDIRQHSPQMKKLLLTMAYASGAGLDADEVGTAGTGAFRELGFVYASDNKRNSGSQFPTTPGHYQDIQCSSGATSIG